MLFGIYVCVCVLGECSFRWWWASDGSVSQLTEQDVGSVIQVVWTDWQDGRFGEVVSLVYGMSTLSKKDCLILLMMFPATDTEDLNGLRVDVEDNNLATDEWKEEFPWLWVENVLLKAQWWGVELFFANDIFSSFEKRKHVYCKNDWKFMITQEMKLCK